MGDVGKVCVGWVIGMVVGATVIGIISGAKVNKELPPAEPTSMNWEAIAIPKITKNKRLFRTRIRAKGWLVLWANSYGSDLEFIPDEKGSWDKGVDARNYHKAREGLKKRINLKRAFDEEEKLRGF